MNVEILSDVACPWCYIGQIDIGGMPFDKVAQAIELLGTEVAPVVRREMAKAGQA